MADYIYLLENRLSKAQQDALDKVREVARAKGLTSFLVGGAVRDLTSGSPVRDLDVVVQGNAPKLKERYRKSWWKDNWRRRADTGFFCQLSRRCPAGDRFNAFGDLPEAR